MSQNKSHREQTHWYNHINGLEEEKREDKIEIKQLNARIVTLEKEVGNSEAVKLENDGLLEKLHNSKDNDKYALNEFATLNTDTNAFISGLQENIEKLNNESILYEKTHKQELTEIKRLEEEQGTITVLRDEKE